MPKKTKTEITLERPPKPQPGEETLDEELLSLVSRSTTPALIEGAIIGTLAPFVEGRPMVRLPDGRTTNSAAPARTTIDLTPDQVGQEVVVLCEGGDPTRPIIMGVLKPAADDTQSDPVAEVDGERVVLSAEKEIVLRCGKASITLTREGKVLIRGAYLLSRSSGPNRIKGGSIQLN